MTGAIRRELPRGASVLDVFTGSGVLAVAAAAEGAADVTAVDVSRRAVACARINARLNGVTLRARRGDLFAPVAGRRFDAIVANPPYVPGDLSPDRARGEERAWEGGPDGRAFLDRLCAEATDHLHPSGVLLLVQSSVSGLHKTSSILSDAGLDPEVVARRRGPLGPLLAGRAGALESRGMLEPGQREEELLVIRARRPDS
jgi:release factor glutamine methyltransferase